MKFRFLYCFALIVLLLAFTVEGKLVRREYVADNIQTEEISTYIIVLKDSLTQEAFDTKISTLTTLIGEENITQVYRMPGFRGLAANVSNSLIKKIEKDDAVDYIEKDSTVSIN
ncbi:hypothetical protein H8356DRAFT_1036675 [Neocallimastix lanati (nom. inval.)]|uniref:Inhibitor I9 domain-containing protein n=1 Tax=Neocallimastix californiae TaxID=1754190 RepID=A0A1Y2B928_9FUNG|nr:hypothetical protein H8356DRAFT_1036675 [Neocallimastix sp. JGI-2020a]ORY31342.1 hypothetical protein LY90DRAFT_673695 [Neocallimastix californiae]|eukprot:ORY31342.1 hypothetical protein LY90DRAFT_673695 [Neocallimastix californiae]